MPVMCIMFRLCRGQLYRVKGLKKDYMEFKDFIPTMENQTEETLNMKWTLVLCRGSRFRAGRSCLLCQQHARAKIEDLDSSRHVSSEKGRSEGTLLLMRAMQALGRRGCHAWPEPPHVA